MTAALPVFMIEQGVAENEQVKAIERMFTRALGLYMDDARDALHGSRIEWIADDDHDARNEALDDLTGSREQLAHLCDMLGLDLDDTAKVIARQIEATPCHLDARQPNTGAPKYRQHPPPRCRVKKMPA